MSKVKIRVLCVDDWELYKTLRLRALQDSPNAFASSFKHESDLSSGEWKAKLDPDRRKTKALPLVAEIDGKPQGLAWGVVHNNDSTSAYVYQMWVTTDSRGQGVGRALLQYIIAWAREMRLDALKLSVATDNVKAASLYESMGFSVIVAGSDQQRHTVGSQLMALGLHDVVAD